MNKQLYRLSFILFGFLISFLPSSAQVQHGYVKTRGRLAAGGTVIAGQRLNGATISIKGKGNVVSKNNGKANGTFSFNMPGKTFCLTNVQKNGYQLCDRDLIGNPFQHSANDLIVVMDTPENALQDKLTSERKIRRTLQRQLQEKEDGLEVLKEQQKISLEEYRKQLQELYAAQENNEKLIADMAERYSTLDFDQLDEFQRRVAAFIQNGELTRADSLLNTKGSMEERKAKLEQSRAVIDANAKDLERRQKEQEDAIALRKKELNDFAADCYSRYEICKMQHKNDSAAYWLKLRASMDTLNVDWLIDSGSFISKYLENNDEAIKYFRQALNTALAKYREQDEKTGVCYSHLGLTYYKKEDYKTALLYFQKALNNCLENHGEKHSSTATAYNNIGLAYYSLNDKEKGLTYIQKSLDLSIELLGGMHPSIATSYFNLAVIYLQKSPKDPTNIEKALEYSLKSLRIREEVLEKNHLDTAENYCFIGAVYCEQKKYKEALPYWEDGLCIIQEVLGTNSPKTIISKKMIHFIKEKLNSNE